ncbi:hypothetical protein OQA88_5819 [Cercophora sp. LCS_1]
MSTNDATNDATIDMPAGSAPTITHKATRNNATIKMPSSAPITKHKVTRNDTAAELIRANPASRHQEDCFHHIKTWLKNPTPDQPYARCPMCFTNIDIAGVQPMGTDEHVPGVALFCGHIFCADCYATQLDIHEDSFLFWRPPLPCAVCRAINVAQQCLCMIKPVMIPFNRPDGDPMEAANTKDLLHEVGDFPDICNHCRRTDKIFKRHKEGRASARR